MDRDAVIAKIRAAFAGVPHPGSAFLAGSREGSEPAETTAPFVGIRHWADLDPAVLDRHYDALSFLSEGGFRFALPAYLIADLRGQLQTADPVFHLTHGFHDTSMEVRAAKRTFTRRTGGRELLNPRRYGAMTWTDYARFRLSVFTREEAQAIVAYLEYRSESDAQGPDHPAIEAALTAFWRIRTAEAPSGEDLVMHLAEEDEFMEATQHTHTEGGGR